MKKQAAMNDDIEEIDDFANDAEEEDDDDNFDPDAYLAKQRSQSAIPNQVNNDVEEEEDDDDDNFDPDSYLAKQRAQSEISYNTEPEEEKEDKRDVDVFLQNQIKGLASGLTSSGAGLIGALATPKKTAAEIANSIASIDKEGIYRTVRNTQLIGPAINSLAASVSGDKDAFYKSQNELDAKHEEEHPLTDFIQKNAGTLLLPSGKLAQAGIMAVDTFYKSMNQGSSITDALRDARNTVLFAGGILGTAHLAGKVPGKVGKYIQKEAGVTDEAISRLKQNPEAINNASKYVGDIESLKDMVDARVSPINKAVIDAETRLLDAKKAVTETKRTPELTLGELQAHLGDTSKNLKKLSGESFDILSDEGLTFPADKMINAVQDKMEALKIAKVVPTSGSAAEAYNQLGKFKDEVDLIGKNTNGQIPAPMVKSLVQRLQDISEEAYTQKVGSLTPKAARNMADVSASYNRMLKDASPKFEAKMSEIAPTTNAVVKMSDLFGDPLKARLSLKAAADPQSPRGIMVRDTIKQYDLVTGGDFLKQIENYYDVPKSMLPKAQDDLFLAQQKADLVNKLGPNSTESIVNQLQLDKNIAAKRQLKELDPDLYQKVEDTGFARQFSKSTTNGSRKAKIMSELFGAGGTAVGSMAAGPAGAVALGNIGRAVGSFVGGAGDVYGGQIVKNAVEAGIKLDKITNTPYMRPLMEAAKRGTRAAAVTHFILSQSDEKYRDLNSGK